MNASAGMDGTTVLSESQRAALIGLLADEDPAIHHTIRAKLLAFGPQVVDWLKPYTLSGEPLLRRRAQDVIQFFDRQSADREFTGFCLRCGEELDLEHASWLLARTHYPETNREAYQALLDDYAGQLREILNLAAPADEILSTINSFLFNSLGFFGNEQNYYDPDNSYLNRVIDRRTGNPISLCTMYILVTRRLRLPISGIGLPGHFICRFQSTTEERYIDVFNRGRILTKADCIKYLHQTSHGLHEGYLTPVSSRQMLMRMCANLHQVYDQLEKPAEAARFQRYIATLSK